VRHGKTREGKDKEGLIKEGKKQALLLAKKFKNVKISKIYSSDLKRAKETAKIIEKELRIPPIITSTLREWEGEVIMKDRKKWTNEQNKNFLNLKDFLNSITKDRNSEETILIVSHGHVNKLIISHFMKINHKKTISFKQENTCINLIEWNERFKNWRLCFMNDTSHLLKKN